MNYSSKKNSKGFTLIEMLVAVGLFAIVMLISTAVILSIINGNRKSQAINTVVNNLNFSIESMIRDMKTGYWYTCDDYVDNGGDFSQTPVAYNEYKDDYMNQGAGNSPFSCLNVPQPVSYITFVSTLDAGNPRIVEYKFVAGSGTTPGQIFKIYDPVANDTDDTNIVNSPLTTPDIDDQQFDLYINNPAPALNPTDKLSATQPSVFLVLKGNTKIGSQDTDVSSFSVQTFISQRLLNI